MTVVACVLTPLPAIATTSYEPATFDFSACENNLPKRADWISVFRLSIPTFVAHALTDGSVAPEARQVAAARFQGDFEEYLGRLEQGSDAATSSDHAETVVNTFSLCAAREDCLRRAGFHDIFKQVKQEENRRALSLLPALLTELDVKAPASRWELILRGVFAGNIFDLGAAASAALFENQGASASAFAQTRDKLLPRPWVIDDMDRILQRVVPSATSKPYHKAVLFVDNAGSDVVLGMLPLARELARLGTKVILAANEVPSINDITAAELGPLVMEAGKHDAAIREALQDGRLRVMSSGNDLPVIDLRKISPALASASQDADLIVLEGMGRSIESNLYASFKCDSWKLGMIKHPEVATCLGGRLYDCVCKYDTALG